MTGSFTAVSDGVYDISYTLDKAGQYLLTLEIQLASAGPFYPIKDTGILVTVSINQVDASNTLLSGPGLTDSVAGEVA